MMLVLVLIVVGFLVIAVGVVMLAVCSDVCDGECVMVVVRMRKLAPGHIGGDGDVQVDGVYESDYDGGKACGGDINSHSNDNWGGSWWWWS